MHMSIKVSSEELRTQWLDEYAPKKVTGTPKPQERKRRDIKSPKQICRFYFPSSSMVTGHWSGGVCTEKEGGKKSWTGEFFL
jgi:hypothetical protein